jgi:hypothetical protein
MPARPTSSRFSGWAARRCFRCACCISLIITHFITQHPKNPKFSMLPPLQSCPCGGAPRFPVAGALQPAKEVQSMQRIILVVLHPQVSFYRPNLRFSIVPKQYGQTEDGLPLPLEALAAFIRCPPHAASTALLSHVQHMVFMSSRAHQSGVYCTASQQCKLRDRPGCCDVQAAAGWRLWYRVCPIAGRGATGCDLSAGGLQNFVWPCALCQMCKGQGSDFRSVL